MDQFKSLTKYIPLIEDDHIGRWHIDRENDGTPEHPIQFPFVVFSEMVNQFVDDVYAIVEGYPEWDNEESHELGYVDIGILPPTPRRPLPTCNLSF